MRIDVRPVKLPLVAQILLNWGWWMIKRHSSPLSGRVSAPASLVSRRDAVLLLSASAAAWPLAVRAQQTGRVPIIGLLGAAVPATQEPLITIFVQRLRELGWIEGNTIAIERRWAEGRTE